MAPVALIKKETDMKSFLLGAGTAFILAAGAQASVIPALTGVTPDGSDFLFSYQGQLAPDQGVIAGDELVIVDFAGYVPGSVSSSLTNVTASISYTLPAGLLLEPGVTDNPAIPDLVFTYKGPDFDTSGGPFAGDVNFNGLTAESTLGGVMLGSYSAKAVKNEGLSAGTATYNVGLVGVPAPVPEPAVWAMMLVGFGGLGAAMRSRSRSMSAAI
ncbi:MAG TPA: PEPxxWA-CTERM sorting domain-containing protein [Caulobacteraceae bacterium]|nr:PEPxxWA-CTERM sorting domain-containing protein [Caulobacteraceae bacterium]